WPWVRNSYCCRGGSGRKKHRVRALIILTTHNPLLLNYTRPEEVRIVRHDPELGTQVTPLHQVQGINELLKEFGIGELWYLLGEQALVEGKKP
ncbi:MAG: hypothetical protein RMJ98_09390, partial [Myxococcales bacterium]|nr:hypothetical protein [Polyangiaceae bacterium]MDW8249500.1 hypothetical protein [Myxococcales bacterium]